MERYYCRGKIRLDLEELALTDSQYDKIADYGDEFDKNMKKADVKIKLNRFMALAEKGKVKSVGTGLISLANYCYSQEIEFPLHNAKRIELLSYVKRIEIEIGKAKKMTSNNVDDLMKACNHVEKALDCMVDFSNNVFY